MEDELVERLLRWTRGVDAAADRPHLALLPLHGGDVVDVHAELIAQPAVVLLSLLALGLKDRERLHERALCVALDVEMALLYFLPLPQWHRSLRPGGTPTVCAAAATNRQRPRMLRAEPRQATPHRRVVVIH